MNIRKLNEELTKLNKIDVEIALRKLIAEENEAFTSYSEKAKQLEEQGYIDVAKILLDIADEELVHAGELQALLVKEGLAKDEQIEIGMEEVEEKL